MSGWFRFQRFRTRLLFLLGGLLFVALAATYFLVSHANQVNALQHSEINLRIGARVFDDTVAQRIELLGRTADVMTADYAIRQVLAANTLDSKTLSSNLSSFSDRVEAPVALFSPEGEMLANSDRKMDNENRGPFAYLIRLANEHGSDQESGFAYLNKELHVLVVVPLYAPKPEVAAWFGLAFPINRTVADKI
ncbi:MAG TPA: cache domain-containing protein, partial [Candidatus Didemnitutus sp.]|nr:cache domain-containing protein [Candidatus Didemnitutus sp.]